MQQMCIVFDLLLVVVVVAAAAAPSCCCCSCRRALGAGTIALDPTLFYLIRAGFFGESV